MRLLLLKAPGRNATRHGNARHAQLVTNRCRHRLRTFTQTLRPLSSNCARYARSCLRFVRHCIGALTGKLPGQRCSSTAAARHGVNVPLMHQTVAMTHAEC